jgi:hypothetical protein
MSKARSLAIGSNGRPPATSMPAATPQGDTVVGTHEALFVAETRRQCDACGEPLADSEEPGPDDMSGHGVYLWARGDHVHFESAPLCSACASAIGMTALARWEIEEEEG